MRTHAPAAGPSRAPMPAPATGSRSPPTWAPAPSSTRRSPASQPPMRIKTSLTTCAWPKRSPRARSTPSSASKPAMLVVLGGSSPWTVELLARLQTDEVILVGRNEPALHALARFARTEIGTTVEATTDVWDALSRATLILCQARVGGWEGRCSDETEASQWGAYGDESLGIGALRSAMRSQALVASWARAAPGVPTLMFSNPVDLLARCWAEHSHGACISVCETPTLLMRRLPSG